LAPVPLLPAERTNVVRGLALAMPSSSRQRMSVPPASGVFDGLSLPQLLLIVSAAPKPVTADE
jgi:hypothetical protein